MAYNYERTRPLREDITIFCEYDRLVISGDGGPDYRWDDLTVLAELGEPGHLTEDDVQEALAEINDRRETGGPYTIIDADTKDVMEVSTYAGGGA